MAELLNERSEYRPVNADAAWVSAMLDLLVSGVSPEQIEPVLHWALRDGDDDQALWWRQRLHAPRHLAKHWDQVWARYNAPPPRHGRLALATESVLCDAEGNIIGERDHRGLPQYDAPEPTRGLIDVPMPDEPTRTLPAADTSRTVEVVEPDERPESTPATCSEPPRSPEGHEARRRELAALPTSELLARADTSGDAECARVAELWRTHKTGDERQLRNVLASNLARVEAQPAQAGGGTEGPATPAREPEGPAQAARGSGGGIRYPARDVDLFHRDSEAGSR